ncbi:Ferredoxin (4Fe-4S iron-sulfur cluster binding protein) [Desulfamplus magnetovallimortis]|uniref:Ferredoxin (4Fe-4S iron-sulfur cluster binding protein) n=1 Tax=Desulfamplus magnetovallimortis TaxID=1246637 RepID=A0A1W1H9L1_9BACT|nr:4Fe-4S dicluster domain-containing protein [Desulfamplus magnetovallimortis]MBF0233517.1 4Fe-4S binding protein [Desulfamplus sp.]SLM29095.1 Ferredoxin (4Fe-4S iron-sulfur cluster binding protein) [Desulfamplus magnetovallimortis]
MTASIYHQLREQMDQYSTGFPATKSGVELKILEKLFTEEDAELYLDLSMLLESAENFAARTNRSPEDASAKLENMAQRGLLFRHVKNGNKRYSAIPFVVGSYEFQLGRMDEELARLTNSYMEEAFLSGMANNIPPLRTIPVGKSVDVVHQVAAYEDAKAIVNGKSKIAVANCICRTQQNLLDKGCNKPMEVCLLFGSHAEYYVENKMGRYITSEEACKILDQCEEAGLVNQPANMVNPGGMCNCCGDCCGVLRALNLLPNPGELVYNRYWAVIDQEECTGCEACLDRCQMNAITIDDTAKIDEARCIGCGLCVTTCPMDAIKLEEKPKELQVPPPASGKELMDITAEKRGTNLVPIKMQQ